MKKDSYDKAGKAMKRAIEGESKKETYLVKPILPPDPEPAVWMDDKEDVSMGGIGINVSSEDVELNKLGKISLIRYGKVVCSPDMIGLIALLEGSDWSNDIFEVASAIRAAPETFLEINKFVFKLLEDAKETHIENLKGKPVEASFGSGGLLVSWRILTEVL